MNREAVEKCGPIAAARKSALMTQKDMADVVGCTVNTLLRYEKEPELMTVGTLRKIYEAVGKDGRALIWDYLDRLLVD